jgi:small subunit ribosomal protein S4e
MAKKGEKKHMKRIAKPKAIPIIDKKASKFITRTACGPHQMKGAVPLSVLLRDMLQVAMNAKEARTILRGRMVEIDGTVRTAEDFPVGIMDAVALPKAGKYYRIVVDWKGRLKAIETTKEDSGRKIMHVVRKHVAPGAKITLTFHDGRNMLGDNKVRCGDSVIVSLPKPKILEHLKLEPGARCLVREGKHAGSIVTLNELMERKARRPSEAKVTGADKDEFITVAKYLFVVDSKFGVSQ